MRRSRTSIPPMFTTRDLAQLVFLVTLLVTAILGIDRLRRPDEWRQFFSQEKLSTEVEIEKPRVNSRFAEVEGPRPRVPNELVIANAGGQEDEPVAEKQAVAPGKPTASGRVNPENWVQTDECEEVDQFLLDKVKDKTGREPEDNPAIYQLLCVAGTTPPEQLAKQARRDVLFTNLWNDPAAYRGKPIHIKGVLARLAQWENVDLKNPYAIAKYYEAWIYPEDQSANPVVILFAKLPEGLAPGTKLKENVSINAFFFKLFAYQAQDDKVHAAPMLIGYELKHQQLDASNVSREGLAVAIGFVCLILFGTAVYWWMARRDEQLAERLRESAEAVPGPELDFSGGPFSDASSNRPTALEPPTDPFSPDVHRDEQDGNQSPSGGSP